MNRESYLIEVESRLKRIFSASKEGYKVTPAERHRLEGFMQAAVFMKLASNAELAKLMEAVHLSVFGKTIQQRKTEQAGKWQDEMIDYSQYEQPAYERKTG